MKEFNEAEWLEIVKNQKTELLYAPHEKDGKFFNPWLPMDVDEQLIRKMLSYFVTKPKKIPKNIDFEYVVANKYTYGDADNAIAFLGHASFVIRLDGSVIFTDPFFSTFAAVVKRKTKVKVDYGSLPLNPVVLISHNHYDHLDKKSVKKLIARNAIFIVPLNLGKFFTRFGAKEVYELDWWQSKTINGIKYTSLPAQHWSLRIRQPMNTTLWGGFMIEGSKTIYFSGDTGYFCGYREFGKKFPSIDYALLAVGAYHPRWQRYYQHQSVDDFFVAIRELNAKVAVPMHYGILKLGKESIDFPAYEVFLKTAEELKEKVKIMKIGEASIL